MRPLLRLTPYTDINELLQDLRMSLKEHPTERDTLKAIATIARRDGLEAGIAAYEAWKRSRMPSETTPAQSAPAPKLQLRDYQQAALDQLYDWFAQYKTGNPCIVLPTGAGKSHVVAALCKDALTQWPETKILMATHVKELIEQNLEKLLLHWPNAPVGVYSASVGRKELGYPITYAGIQSIWRRAEDVGHVDLVVIDEAHLVSHKDTGMYRTLLDGLARINPRLRVVGLTATPFRLGHGLITDPPAIFSKPLIKPASLTELIAKGYLAPLQSKATDTTYDVSGVSKRNGDYVESELQAAVDKDDLNQSVVDEIIARAGNRRSWLVFCAGVKHAAHIAEELRQRGIEAACVTGETPKPERERLIGAFKAGKIRVLTNANVLTTGFDHPDVDLIAMLRPTESPGLYVQMAGRGLRPKSHTDHCLVLDFAGVVERHGPITAVEPPEKTSSGNGRAPVKKCPQCRELVHAKVKQCPACGYDFPPAERTVNLWLRDADIMGGAAETQSVTGWHWTPHYSVNSGRWLLLGEYHTTSSRLVITQYLTLFYPGFPGRRAQADIEALLGEPLPKLQGSEQEKLEELAEILNQKPAPSEISFVRDGKFFRITSVKWRLL